LLVQCNDQVKQVAKLFEGVAKECSQTSECAVGVMDCSTKLAKGKKDIYSRFNLPKSKKKEPKYPTAFLIANGKHPVEIPSKLLSKKSSHSKLLDFVREKSKVGVMKIKNSGGLRRHCLSRSYCALLSTVGKPSAEHRAAVRKLMKKHRTVQFAILASNEPSMLQLDLKPQPEGFIAASSSSPQWVLFKRLSRSSKSTKRIKSGAIVYDGSVSALDGMDGWLKQMRKASSKEFQLLSRAPRLLSAKRGGAPSKKKAKPASQRKKKKTSPEASATTKPTTAAADLPTQEDAADRKRREVERRAAMEAEMAANTPEYVVEDEESDWDEDLEDGLDAEGYEIGDEEDDEGEYDDDDDDEAVELLDD